jgi:phage shock protein C
MVEKAKRLVRPKKGRVIAGVALGLANYFNVDVTIVRIVWVFLFIPGGMPGLVPYVILWILMPSEK